MGLFDIFNSEKKTKNDKSQSDSKIDLINNKRIAIFGFGNQAQAHALNLQDSGKSNIVIALREDSKNISKAESKGFNLGKTILSTVSIILELNPLSDTIFISYKKIL